MSRVSCKSCGTELAPRVEVCPKCGSRDKAINLSAEVSALPMIIAKQFALGIKKYLRRLKVGLKISGKTHRVTREDLRIDRVNRRKYHHVEEQDESGNWRTCHHEDEPLSQKNDQVAKDNKSQDAR